MAAIAPTDAPDREPVLDVVRGVALFGVLTVNALTIFRVSLFEEFMERRPEGGAEEWIGHAVTTALEMKAFILFSFLFGVGLAAQRERVGGRGEMGFGRFAGRRLAFLLALGLVHLVLVWNGDILTLYAALGIVAAPLVARASTRLLVVLAAALFVLQVAPVPWPAAFAGPDDVRAHVEAAEHVYRFGSFRHVLAFRVLELRPIGALLLWCAPRTLGLFLLGAVAWRARLFRRAGLLVRLALPLLAAGALATWLVHSGRAGPLRGVLDGWGAASLALGYGAAIAATFHESPRARRLLLAFAPLGRMALTSYLTQSIVLGWIFYGYGLGRFGMLGRVETLGIVLALFAGQMVFARAWLGRYRHGPVEWAWRSFTYGARQPLRRAVAAALPP